MLLNDKVAIITGAGSGVGRAAALLFAREGARVVLGDIREDWGEETLRLVREAGGEGRFCPCDVRREADVAGLVETAVGAYGRLDVVFNNAGVSKPPSIEFEDYEDGDWDRLMDINLWGAFYGCKHAVRQFKKQGGGGVIVNTGSAAGLVGWGGPVYGASKGAVIQLTRSLAIDAAPHNIRVNCICPGAMPTGFAGAGSGFATRAWTEKDVASLGQYHPLGRAIAPEDSANAALFLASDLAANITGVALPVDGGYTAR